MFLTNLVNIEAQSILHNAKINNKSTLKNIKVYFFLEKIALKLGSLLRKASKKKSYKINLVFKSASHFEKLLPPPLQAFCCITHFQPKPNLDMPKSIEKSLCPPGIEMEAQEGN